MNVVWLTPARIDAKEIFDFYRDKEAAAYIKRLEAEFARITRQLEHEPYAGKKVPKYDVEEYRQILCDNYWIYYYVTEDRVEIQNVIHTSRDF